MTKAQQDRWLTVADVADYLQLSRAKIYSLAKSGDIPCTKVAGQWRFKRQEVDTWMQDQRGSGTPDSVKG